MRCEDELSHPLESCWFKISSGQWFDDTRFGLSDGAVPSFAACPSSFAPVGAGGGFGPFLGCRGGFCALSNLKVFS